MSKQVVDLLSLDGNSLENTGKKAVDSKSNKEKPSLFDSMLKNANTNAKGESNESSKDNKAEIKELKSTDTKSTDNLNIKSTNTENIKEKHNNTFTDVLSKKEINSSIDENMNNKKSLNSKESEINEQSKPKNNSSSLLDRLILEAKRDNKKTSEETKLESKNENKKENELKSDNKLVDSMKNEFETKSKVDKEILLDKKQEEVKNVEKTDIQTDEKNKKIKDESANKNLNKDEIQVKTLLNEKGEIVVKNNEFTKEENIQKTDKLDKSSIDNKLKESLNQNTPSSENSKVSLNNAIESGLKNNIIVPEEKTEINKTYLNESKLEKSDRQISEVDKNIIVVEKSIAKKENIENKDEKIVVIKDNKKIEDTSTLEKESSLLSKEKKSLEKESLLVKNESVLTEEKVIKSEKDLNISEFKENKKDNQINSEELKKSDVVIEDKKGVSNSFSSNINDEKQVIHNEVKSTVKEFIQTNTKEERVNIKKEVLEEVINSNLKNNKNESIVEKIVDNKTELEKKLSEKETISLNSSKNLESNSSINNMKDSKDFLTNIYLSTQKNSIQKQSIQNKAEALAQVKNASSTSDVKEAANKLDLSPENMNVETVKTSEVKKDEIAQFEKKSLLDRLAFNRNLIQDETKVAISKSVEVNKAVLENSFNQNTNDVTVNVNPIVAQSIQSRIIGARQAMATMMSDVARQMYENYKPPVTVFRINLNPANLGTIAIMMKSDKDNAINISLNISNSSTLEAFVDNQNGLRNALTKTFSEDASFNLDFNSQDSSNSSNQNNQEQKSFEQEVNTESILESRQNNNQEKPEENLDYM